MKSIAVFAASGAADCASKKRLRRCARQPARSRPPGVVTLLYPLYASATSLPFVSPSTSTGVSPERLLEKT
jgi:hypothetical protein